MSDKIKTTFTIDEMNIKISELKKDLMNLRFQKSYGQLTNTSNIRKVKKDIARMKTLMHTHVNVNGAQ